MEGSNLPPPAPSLMQPGIGESSKVRSALDLLNITKILALIIGILGFIAAAWDGFVMVAYGDFLSVPWVGYYIITGIIDLLIYTKIPEFDSLIRSRRYGEAKDTMMIWAVLGVIFGFLAGLLMLLIIFMYLEELEHGAGNYSNPPPPQQPPPY